MDADARCFRLVVEFDGSGFEGWQLQRQGQRTVQGCLADAAAKILGDPVRVRGSSRTDSGVHAEGLVASLQATTRLSPEELLQALNGVLPHDLAVSALGEVPESFDPRRDARWKRYRYAIWNAPQRSPLRARRALHVRAHLDLDAMREAASGLVGRHDFRCFQAAGSAVETTVRTVYRLEVSALGEGEIAVEVEGSGFLRYMVRNIVGTLLEVGRGRRSAGEMPDLLISRDRRRAGPTAAAHGLTLVEVGYTPHSSETDSPEGRGIPEGVRAEPLEHPVSADKSKA